MQRLKSLTMTGLLFVSLTGVADAEETLSASPFATPSGRYALNISFICETAKDGPLLRISFKNETSKALRLAVDQLPFSTSGGAIKYEFNRRPTDQSKPLFGLNRAPVEFGLVEVPSGSELVGYVGLHGASDGFFRAVAEGPTFLTWDYSPKDLPDGAKVLGQSGGIYLSNKDLKCRPRGAQ